jgi:hypothetical protein
MDSTSSRLYTCTGNRTLWFIIYLLFSTVIILFILILLYIYQCPPIKSTSVLKLQSVNCTCAPRRQYQNYKRDNPVSMTRRIQNTEYLHSKGWKIVCMIRILDQEYYNVRVEYAEANFGMKNNKTSNLKKLLIVLYMYTQTYRKSKTTCLTFGRAI